MPTLDIQVAAGVDDAHERASGTGFSSGATAVLMTSSVLVGSRYNGGFLFKNVTIPQGTPIVSALLRIWTTTGDDPHVDIYANDVDNASDFSLEADVTSRVLTTAFVQWDATNLGVGLWADSPDIASVVQEVTDRAGWASGNALCILPRGSARANLSFGTAAYDGEPTHAARLVVSYGAAGGFNMRNYWP